MISIIGNETHRDRDKATKPVTASKNAQKKSDEDEPNMGLVTFEHEGNLTPLDTLFDLREEAKTAKLM